MKRFQWTSLCAGAAMLALLAACGGGGSDEDTSMVVVEDPGIPPASAAESEAGFVAYTATVASTAPDSAPADPVDLSNFTPPVSSDNNEPQATSADEGA